MTCAIFLTSAIHSNKPRLCACEPGCTSADSSPRHCCLGNARWTPPLTGSSGDRWPWQRRCKA